MLIGADCRWVHCGVLGLLWSCRPHWTGQVSMETMMMMIRGGNREPVPTQNRFQLTNSIGIVRLQRYRFFLTIPHFPARRFPVFPKFCVAVHCVTVDAMAQTFQQQGSSIMERRKRSKVWLHFTKRDENAAVCNQCNAAISCKGANTSNMLKHLSTRGGRYTGIIVITGVTLRHDMDFAIPSIPW